MDFLHDLCVPIFRTDAEHRTLHLAVRHAVCGQAVGAVPSAIEHALNHLAASAAPERLGRDTESFAEGIVGGDHAVVIVEHHETVIDAVQHAPQLGFLIAHLVDEARDRSGHVVELCGHGGDHVVAIDHGPLPQFTAGDGPRRSTQPRQPDEDQLSQNDGHAPEQEEREATVPATIQPVSRRSCA